MLAGLPADQIGGDDGRVGGRLIHVPDEFRQEFGDVWFDDDAMIFATKMSRQTGRYVGVVQCGFADAVLGRKGDRVRAYRLAGGAGHHGHDAR